MSKSDEKKRREKGTEDFMVGALGLPKNISWND
jgi:hypothetical protein